MTYSDCPLDLLRKLAVEAPNAETRRLASRELTRRGATASGDPRLAALDAEMNAGKPTAKKIEHAGRRSTFQAMTREQARAFRAAREGR